MRRLQKMWRHLIHQEYIPESPGPNWLQARTAMIETQLRGRGIKDEKLLQVIGQVPRHRFVPEAEQNRAYEDHPIQIGCRQTISQPYMVALMTEMLNVRPEDCVLEIGTGSGYQTAILAALAREVVSIERHAALAEHAQKTLSHCGYHNVQILVSDGTLGCPEYAPYDAILVTAGAPALPTPLKEQLAPGGRLVCPVGSRDMQHLLRVKRQEDGSFTEETGAKCIFVPLLGKAGWQNHAE